MKSPARHGATPLARALSLLSQPLPLGALTTLFSALILLPGLSELGFWSELELPILNRARGMLGLPFEDLKTSPWLPDWLRTQSYRLFAADFSHAQPGAELGLRLPGLVASAMLVGFCASFGRRAFSSTAWALLAAAFALSFPLLSFASTTIAGNPIGECLSTAIVWLGFLLLSPNASLSLSSSRSGGIVARQVLLFLSILVAGSLSVAAQGLFLGLVLPLAALYFVRPKHPFARFFGALSFLGLLVVGVQVWRQGEGFIPLLGFSKDLELLQHPQSRSFVSTLEEYGAQTFPWLGFVIVGAATLQTNRWIRSWLALALAFSALWSLAYGSVTASVIVPSALLTTHALRVIVRANRSASARRLALVISVMGIFAFRGDLKRSPSHFVQPIGGAEHEHKFPGEEADLTQRLSSVSRLAAGLSIAAFLLSPPSPAPTLPPPDGSSSSGRVRFRRLRSVKVLIASRFKAMRETTISKTQRLFPPKFRIYLACATLGVASLSQFWNYRHRIYPALNDLLSPKSMLTRYIKKAEQGILPMELATFRTRDPGIDFYKDESIVLEDLQSRGELKKWLDYLPHQRSVSDKDGSEGAQAGSAIIRRGELAQLFQIARAVQRPLFVLDNSHDDLVLVSNHLPKNDVDQNPLAPIVKDEAPQLRNKSELRFDQAVEIIGWQVNGEARRGKRIQIEIAFRVDRRLSPGTKIYTRLQMGKLSRINSEPYPLTDRLYPGHLWRAGDFVLHRYEINIPWTTTLPGKHKLIVALKKSDKENYKITLPEGKKGKHGVRVRGKKREFASVGWVDIR